MQTSGLIRRIKHHNYNIKYANFFIPLGHNYLCFSWRSGSLRRSRHLLLPHLSVHFMCPQLPAFVARCKEIAQTHKIGFREFSNFSKFAKIVAQSNFGGILGIGAFVGVVAFAWACKENEQDNLRWSCVQHCWKSWQEHFRYHKGGKRTWRDRVLSDNKEGKQNCFSLFFLVFSVTNPIIIMLL